MFRLIGKLIKWAFIAFVAIVAYAIYDIATDPEQIAQREADRAVVAECHATHGEIYCDSKGNALDKATVDAEIAAKKAADEKRAAKKAESDKRMHSLTLQSNGKAVCKDLIKQAAMYPATVKFDWSTDDRMWENFNGAPGKPVRYSMNQSGEMKNGFGMTVPFQAHCKIDMNMTSTQVQYNVVDFWVN